MQELIGLIVSLAGLCCVGYVFYKGRLALTSESWPTVEGKILTASVERNSSGGGNYGTANRTFEAVIRYAYGVSGRALNGSTICIGGELNTSFRERAEQRCSRYAPGRSVTVHYNPDDPKVCCLETTSEIGPLGYAIGGAFTIIGGLVFLHIIGPG